MVKGRCSGKSSAQSAGSHSVPESSMGLNYDAELAHFQRLLQHISPTIVWSTFPAFIYVFMYAFVYLFILLFIYSLTLCQVGQVGLTREKAWILEDVHFISAFPAPVVKFLTNYGTRLKESLESELSARFPTLQTITGTRLLVLALTDVLCMHVGTLQVIFFVTIFLFRHCFVATF